MSSEPADGVRPVHAARCEWILSGARGKGGSPEYPTPLLSRYREMISSPEPADFPPGPKRIVSAEMERFFFPNQGGTANLSSLYG